MPIMQFGKYKGRDITEVPDSYLEWIIRDAEDKIHEAKGELGRRTARVNGSFVMKIVEAGFLSLVNSDPSLDKGKLTSARDILLRAITDAGKVQDDNTPF